MAAPQENKPFNGATHRFGDEYVKAVQWKKDGDHPDVVRYPIERREFKGLLVVSEKQKFALKFGDWIVENAAGQVYVVSGQSQEVEELVEEQPDLFRKVARKLLSAFDQAYIPLILALLALAIVLFAPQGDLPYYFAVTHLMYYSSIKGQWDGTANGVFDLDTDTMKLSAHTNTYSPNQDTHAFFSDTTNEVSGTNYTAGGATLGTVTVTRSTNTVTFDAADIVWTQSGAGFSTGRKFVLYRSTGTGTTSRLFSVVTADADVGNVTGDLTVQWNASGIATWTTT